MRWMPSRQAWARGVLTAAGSVILAAATTCCGAPRALRPYAWEGHTYVSLSDAARFYGMRAERGPVEFILRENGRRLSFEPDGRRSSILGVQVWLQHPLTRARGRWAVNQADFDGLVDPIVRPTFWLYSRRAALVAIDAGHGGRDGGTAGPDGVMEKTLNLDLARRVRRRLAEEGFEVRMTRESDEFLELDERSARAAAWGADVFVSIHLNSSADPASRGVETYVLSKAGFASTNADDQRPSSRYRPSGGNRHDAASAVLGFFVQRRIVETAGAEDRGLRHARFAVLRQAPCAAVLVEGGFLSSPDEARQLTDPAHRDRIADGIARGAADYACAVTKARLAPP